MNYFWDLHNLDIITDILYTAWLQIILTLQCTSTRWNYTQDQSPRRELMPMFPCWFLVREGIQESENLWDQRLMKINLDKER